MQIPAALRNLRQLDERVFGTPPTRRAPAAPAPTGSRVRQLAPDGRGRSPGGPPAAAETAAGASGAGAGRAATPDRGRQGGQTDQGAGGGVTRGGGDGAREVLRIVLVVTRLVLLALAVVVVLAILCTALPTNSDNAIVSRVVSLSKRVAGPFQDVFTGGTKKRRLYYNNALAAAVYVGLALLVGRISSRFAAKRS